MSLEDAHANNKMVYWSEGSTCAIVVYQSLVFRIWALNPTTTYFDKLLKFMYLFTSQST